MTDVQVMDAGGHVADTTALAGGLKLALKVTLPKLRS